MPSQVEANSGRGVLPFVLAAVVVVIVMIGMVVLGGMFRPRRTAWSQPAGRRASGRGIAEAPHRIALG